MSTLYPGAHYMPVPNHSGAMSEHLGLVIHVQAGNGSLYYYFSDRQNQVSSTWWSAKSGKVEQYVDADEKAWAQAAGNGSYNSVETEGIPEEFLTAAQVEALAHLYAWGHHKYGWPFQLAEKPGEPGLAWHGMGGDAWGGHFGCPGSRRKSQREEILKRAEEIAGAIAPAPKPAPQPAPAPAKDTPAWYHRLLEYPPSKLRDPGETATDASGNHYQIGEDVQAVQRKLAIKPDGWFGPTTQAHVKGFQKAHNLSVDGIVGPDTAKALGE